MTVCCYVITTLQPIVLSMVQPYFGHLSCIPLVCMTCKVQYNFHQSVVEKLPSLVKLVSPFRKPINQHIIWGLLFLRSYTSAPGEAPWLHSCGRLNHSVYHNYDLLGQLWPQLRPTVYHNYDLLGHIPGIQWMPGMWPSRSSEKRD